MGWWRWRPAGRRSIFCRCSAAAAAASEADRARMTLTTMMTVQCIMSAITAAAAVRQGGGAAARPTERAVRVDKSGRAVSASRRSSTRRHPARPGQTDRHRTYRGRPPSRLCAVQRWFMAARKTRGRLSAAKQRGRRPSRRSFALGWPWGTAQAHWCPATISRHCWPAGTLAGWPHGYGSDDVRRSRCCCGWRALICWKQ